MALSDTQNEKLGDMLAALEAEMGALNDWETKFVRDQLERHAKYGADVFMSPKQWSALQKIYDAVIGPDPKDVVDQIEDDEVPF